MFCKNCGAEMDNNAAVCVKCGVASGSGHSFCENCGQPLTAGADFCVNCGAKTSEQINPAEQKSKLAAGLLGIFLGSFGIHNFYLGNTGKAVAQLLITLLSCGVGAAVSGIWGLVEGILILTGSINTDAKGNPLKD